LGIVNDQEVKTGGLDKPKQAKTLYKRAATLGNPEAMTNLSLLYLSGRTATSKNSNGSFINSIASEYDSITDAHRKKGGATIASLYDNVTDADFYL